MENQNVYPVIRSKRLFKLERGDCEKGGGISETVPNDAMSIKEIMVRYARGMPITDQEKKEGKYAEGGNFDSPDLEALSRMDLAERSDYLELLKVEIEEKKERLKEAKKASAEAAKLDIQKSKQDRNDTQNPTDIADDDGGKKRSAGNEAKRNAQAKRPPEEEGEGG